MKKLFFVLTAAALFFASCASAPKNEPALPKSDSQEAIQNVPSVSEEQQADVSVPGEQNEAETSDAGEIAATDGNAEAGQEESTAAAEGESSESESAETEMEKVAEEDVIQNEAEEEEQDSSKVAEPEIYEMTSVEIEYDMNTRNSLGKTEPDAQGTTPAQQNESDYTGEALADTAHTDGMISSDENGIASTQGTDAAGTTIQNGESEIAMNSATPEGNGITPQSAASTAPTPTAPATSDALPAATAATSTVSGTTSAVPVDGGHSDAAYAGDDSAGPNANTKDEAAIVPLEVQKAVPSRSVDIKNNQYLDIVYPGSGWVYLGEAEENRDQKKQPLFSYFGRKLGTSDTTFTLRSRKPGSTLLHFYKNDALTGQYIDDYLAVNIDSENAKAGTRASAPAYAEVVPPKPTRQTRQSYTNAETAGAGLAESDGHSTATNAPATTSAQQNTTAPGSQQRITNTMSLPSAQTGAVIPSQEDKGVKTVVQTTESAPGGESKAASTSSVYGGQQAETNGTTAPTAQQNADEGNLDLLEQAKRSYAAQKYEDALHQVQQFLQDATNRIDEALYLQGQVLEAESSVKSVRSAIDSYETLTKNYPMSALWGKANNRIIYLKRFYIEIR